MSNKIILTTCSLNHIAQAQNLGDSIAKFAPGYRFIIGVVDKVRDRFPPGHFGTHEIIEVGDISIAEFEEMHKLYPTYELNCSLKAFFTNHVLNTFKPDIFIFLDSDIMLFDSLHYIEEELKNASILVTPHITNPY